MDAIQVETLDPATADPADLRRVALLNNRVWPKDDFDPDTAAHQIAEKLSEGCRCHVVRRAGVIVAKSHTFARTIGTSRGELTVMALAGVCCDPNHRGEGYGRAVVAAAFGRIDRGEFPASLYQTSHHNRPFYEKLGARQIDNRFVNSLADDPDANPFWDEIAMIYPAACDWPDGVIDLRGPGY